jgi:hypothetical protein
MTMSVIANAKIPSLKDSTRDLPMPSVETGFPPFILVIS